MPLKSCPLMTMYRSDGFDFIKPPKQRHVDVLMENPDFAPKFDEVGVI